MNALFATKDFLHLISEYLPDLLWAKDTQGRYLFANKAICDVLLMSNPDEVVGKTDIYFAQRERAKHPENPNWHTFGELCFNSDEVVLRHLKPMQFEEFGNIKGELTYLEVHKAPLYDKEGVLIGVIGSGRDITAHKKLEQELAMTQQLIEGGPVVVFEWSGEEGWPIQYVSRNITTVLGISYDKLIQGVTKFTDYIHPEDLPKVFREVSAYLEAKTPFYVQEYRLVKEDGGEVWIKDFTIVEYPKEGGSMVIKGYIFDHTAQQLAHQKALYFNHYDQLCNIPNRQKMKLDMNEKDPNACVIFNINRFREINDFFGISVGDGILTQLAHEFKKMGLSPYRIGGDEFAILFHQEISKKALERRVETIIEHCEEMTFLIGDDEIGIRMSAGVAVGSEKLLTRADIAVHTAKEKKISIAIYEENANIEETYKKNIALTSMVHKAIAEGRVVCHYQPIVDVTNQSTPKYETLVRILNEDGTFVPPNDFLPVAKKTKLYSHITKEVISAACHAFEGRTNEFSVNISIDDIEDPITVQEIIKMVIKTKTASRIVFEILESEGIENYDSVVNFITQVKALGAKIAIDDFGTGYSNFEHILKLSIDYIKIDGSLIRGINGNHRHRIIVETIVDFAKKIGVKTIAEYVSDENIYNGIKALGIDYSQGYFTGKPEPLA